MIKGISKNIVCDNCRSIITNLNHNKIVGKKRVLHYCNEKKCLYFYKKVSNC